MASKRNRKDEEEVESLAMNNCMRLLMDKPDVRVFKCKICDREFETFQALGGHTAGHNAKSTEPTKNQKVHRCSTCGEEFGCGQALGGHMRRHRTQSITSEEVTSSDMTIRVDVVEAKQGLKEKKARPSLDLDLNLLAKVEEKNVMLIRHDDDLVEKDQSNLNLELQLCYPDYEGLSLNVGNVDGKSSENFKSEYYEFF